MNKHIGFNWRFYKIINQFLEDERIDILERLLKNLEKDIKVKFGYSKDQEIYFRLFPGDTLITDIQSIKSDYNSSNKNSLLESLQECIEDAQVEIKIS